MYFAFADIPVVPLIIASTPARIGKDLAGFIPTDDGVMIDKAPVISTAAQATGVVAVVSDNDGSAGGYF